MRLKMEKYGYLFAWPVADAHVFVSDYHYDSTVKVPQEPVEGIDTNPPWLEQFGDWRSSTPLSRLTLHREFGQLATEETSVIKFANRYGLLGYPVALKRYGTGKDGNRILVRGQGESLWRWKHEIRDMASWLGVWDLIKAERAGRLGQIIRWPNPDVVLLGVDLRYERGAYEVFAPPKDELGLLYGPIADKRSDPELFKQWRKGDLLGPARWALHQAINKKLRGQTCTQLAWIDLKAVEPYSAPQTLLSAMWLSLMWEVTGASTLLKCPVCGCWAERRDARQKTCSGACRQRKYRNNLRSRAEGGT